MNRFLLVTMLGLSCSPLFGQATNHLGFKAGSQAPGAPGVDAHWPSAQKNGFGTAYASASNVWFTLTDGVMSETFFPTLDTPNTQTLQFVVCRRSQCFEESKDMQHLLQVTDTRALSFRQLNRTSEFSIAKTYTTDVERPTILIDVNFAASQPVVYQIYVHYDPSLGNSGRHDTAWQTSTALLSSDGEICSALIVDSGFAETTSGFAGRSDGLSQLREQGMLTARYARAEDGNVAQLARLNSRTRFTVALGFGKSATDAEANARASLSKGFTTAQREYQASWHHYLARLRKVAPHYQAQFNMAALVLKALEDKQHPGAMIASPSNPWGAGPNANEATTTGYHAVWSRDLYHVATAFLALGDSASANRALDFLFHTQQLSDGSFPQNSRVDGRPIGRATQLDQTAFPILLASQLKRIDRETWLKHVRPAADFIVNHGPATEQERWEEESGYSPATIAAQIAALVCAADIATLNQDEKTARRYLEQADRWTSKVESWTATKNGPYAKGSYFLRLTSDGDPLDGSRIEINSGGGTFDERTIVDAGFLELVRLGIKPANDPLLQRSLAVIDALIKVETPHGAAWYRYNHDAYGEQTNGDAYDGRRGRGRPWPLLTGERGQYDLALGRYALAARRLRSLASFANDGLMLPEQIWDRNDHPRSRLQFGEGTGAATPLAWSMAQFIRLALNLHDRRNRETPEAVRTRYGKR